MSNHVNGVKSVPKWGEPFLNCSAAPGVNKCQGGETGLSQKACGAAFPDPGAHFQGA